MAEDVKTVSSAEEAEVELNPVIEAIRTAFETKKFSPVTEWAEQHVHSSNFWIDLGLVVACGILAWILSLALKRADSAGRLRWLHQLEDKITPDREFKPFALVFIPILWTALLIANGLGFIVPVLRLVALIFTLFFCIGLPSKLVTRGRFWVRTISTLTFVIAALHIMGLLDETTAFLDAQALTLGEVRLSAFSLLKGLFTLVILLWLAGLFSKLAKQRYRSTQDLPPRVQVLLSKSTQVGLYTAAFLLTIGVMGIPIAALAIFGGALGLGLGFGLQKVVSNLVSGIILLLDRSVKPGDVIEIEETYGWINSLNMRHVSVITRDNKEHLIPNEDLITNRVVNWSYSSELVRIRAPIGISYSSDVRKAIELAITAANRIERVQDEPPPKCLLRGFGDNSVDLELRFWITDPSNGVGAVTSQVLLEIWDLFRENGIEFPFPQRDIHIKTGGETLQASPAKKKSISKKRTSSNS
ncbi:MAG: mechanosensitive ion channel domain-containing protein [Verrucomicrobiota bacterium]